MTIKHTRPLASVTALVTASLLTLAGCSDSGSDKDPDGGGDGRAKPAASQTSASQPAVVLTEAQLKKALLTRAETPDYAVQDNDTPAVRPKADKSECRALADMTASGTGRTPPAAAWASRSYGSKTNPGLAVTTSLFSYEGEGAQETMAAVREALTACTGGFTTSGNNGGATVRYASVRSERVRAGGDESVSWQMTGEAQGSKVPMRFTAVRAENTIALLLALHLTDPAKNKLPADLLDSQVDKVTAAGAS